MPAQVSWERVTAVADRALYIAKQSGKNTWVGILARVEVPPHDLVQQILDTPRALEERGVIEISTNLEDPRALVWKVG